jgi:membrane dipeptidase
MRGQQANTPDRRKTDSHAYIDLHCDTLYAAWKKGAEDIFEMDGAMADVSKTIKGGCRLQVYAIYMPDPDSIREAGSRYEGDDAYIRSLHDIFTRTVRQHSSVFAAAGSIRDAERNAAEGKTSGMLSMEDGRAVEGRFEKIRLFHDMGIRIMGLTWNAENCFGYPNSTDPEEMQKGLTAFGKEAVSCMEETGMLIDVSHLSDGGFWDIARICRRPFIASHSNCRALNPHPRSMTDDMIRALADKGGVMGLNFCPEFLTRDPEQQQSTADDLARQLRYRINAGGLACAAIGTDFDGIGGELEFSSADRMPDLFEALEQRGFTPRELDHICRLNAERVMRDVIG